MLLATQMSPIKNKVSSAKSARSQELLRWGDTVVGTHRSIAWIQWCCHGSCECGPQKGYDEFHLQIGSTPYPI